MSVCNKSCILWVYRLLYKFSDISKDLCPVTECIQGEHDNDQIYFAYFSERGQIYFKFEL